MSAFFFLYSRTIPALLLITGSSLFFISASSAADEVNLDQCKPAEIRLFLALAEACEMAYEDSQPGLESTASGCVALIREDGNGNLIIAFRGSMLGDRNPKHPFSNLGGANIRRNYRDWVATNLKQATGFLPRQYVEAAALVENHVIKHPVDKMVFITGHSKGGGAAAYAFVSAIISPTVSGEQAGRMRCITFNAAVVKEQNWRRLYRRSDPGIDPSRKEPPVGSVTALCMRDDPVSKIAASEERSYVKRITIVPAVALTPIEQHGIGATISELQRVAELNSSRQHMDTSKTRGDF